MRPTRRTVLRSIATGGLAVGLAGCTENGGEPTDTEGEVGTPTDTEDGMGTPTDTEMGTETDAGTDTGTDADSMATVQVASVDVGDALVGPDGLTLYMFDNDTQGEGASTCTDSCLDNWPPLTAEDEATAGADVTAELTTFERDDGDTQVAANGWPLYYFAGDGAEGDTNGQGVGEVWWMLTPAGEPIRGGGTETETSSTY